MTAVLASCATTPGNAAPAPGNAETDRIVATVARAIGSPRQDSATGLVRAALATRAGGSQLTVVVAEELHAEQLVDPLARLVFRVHLEASGTGFSVKEPITACSEARFNFYGVIGRPRRVGCPVGAAAIVPAPLPPQARAVIPQGFDGTLQQLMAALPASPSAADVNARVTGGLPAAQVDPNTGVRDLPPTVDAAVDGADIGVSVWARYGRECLLGARIRGEVKVGRPSRVQMEPSELSCDPQTALHLSSLKQPH